MALERRVRSMMQAADTVAMHPLREARRTPPPACGRARAHGEVGHFTLESANNGESMEVRINLASGEIEPSRIASCATDACCRTGAETPPDPRLLELLYRISQRTHQKIILVSGFRAPMFSTATLSYTRAAWPPTSASRHDALMGPDLAFAMGVKGIGYYPVSVRSRRRARDHQYWIGLRLEPPGCERRSTTHARRDAAAPSPRPRSAPEAPAIAAAPPAAGAHRRRHQARRAVAPERRA